MLHVDYIETGKHSYFEPAVVKPHLNSQVLCCSRFMEHDTFHAVLSQPGSGTGRDGHARLRSCARRSIERKFAGGD